MKRSVLVVLVVLVVLAVLSACSGGQDAKPLSIQQLAARVGCQGFRWSHTQLFVAAQGTCDGVPGVDDVATFNNNDARDSWLQFAHHFGSVCDAGDQWVVCGPNRAAVQRQQSVLGGDIHD